MCKAIIDFISSIFSKPTPVIAPVEIQLPDKIEPNPWEVFSSIAPNDLDHVLKITYCDEFGTPKTFFCMAVFSNDQTGQYKLVSPDFGPGIIIERGNVTDFTAIKVTKDEKDNYGKLK